MSAEARVVARAMRVQPRVVLLEDAPRYLGMSKEQFSIDVRPMLNEVSLANRKVAFDREELDEWWSEFMFRNARRGKKPTTKEIDRWQRKDAVGALGSTSGKASGTSTSSIETMDAYAKARAQALSKKQKSS